MREGVRGQHYVLMNIKLLFVKLPLFDYIYI